MSAEGSKNSLVSSEIEVQRIASVTSYLGKNVATNLQNGDIHLAKITDFGVGYPWDDISRAIGALRDTAQAQNILGEGNMKRAAEDLIKKYFDQIVHGCGRAECDNEFCASSGHNSEISKDEAAAMALRLMFKRAKLCDTQELKPVGLTEARLVETINICKSTGDYKPLVRLIGEVFSSSEVLSRSFITQDTITPESKESIIPVDIKSVERSYHVLFQLENQSIENALVNAVCSLGSGIQLDLRTNPSTHGVEFLNQFVIVLCNPNLQSPEYIDFALPAVLKAVSYLPVKLQKLLVNYWSKYSADDLKQLLNILHQLITVQLVAGPNATSGTPVNDDSSIAAATKCMKLLFYASVLGGKFERSCKIPDHSDNTNGKNEAGPSGTDPEDESSKDKLLEELKLDISKSREPLLSNDDFINETLNDKIEMDRDFTNYKYGEPRFAFLNYPFVLNTASKSLGLYFDNRVRMYSERRLTMIFSFMQGQLSSPYLRLRVRRDHLIEDALVWLEIVAKDNPGDFKKQLIVEFEGEQGIDEGGVSKEFFQLVIDELFNPDYGMFLSDGETRLLWFNPTSFETEGQFKLVGLLFGLAIYNGVILDVSFPMVLYRKLLGNRGKLEDLESSHPVVYRGLKELLDYTGDTENDFMLTFQFGTFQVGYQDVFGNELTHDLKENASQIYVTQDNKEEYVDMYADFLLNKSIETQFKAFKTGFDIVTEDSLLKSLFRPEELERLLCGSKDFDMYSLENSTDYDGGYGKDHPVIKYFWEVVHSMTNEEQRKLLAFTTGSDRVPVGGLAKLKLIIAKNGPDSDRLPTAHTCFNVLLMPEYSSKEKLKERLMKAISNAKGFGLM